MENNLCTNFVEYEVHGNIGEEWLTPAAPPDLLSNAEDRVNYVLSKNSIPRAKSKGTIGQSNSNIKLNMTESGRNNPDILKIERCYSRQEQLNFSHAVDQTPKTRVYKQNINGQGSAIRKSQAGFGKYSEYLNSRPNKRATSSQRDQKINLPENTKSRLTSKHKKLNHHHKSEANPSVPFQKRSLKQNSGTKTAKKKAHRRGIMNFQRQIEVNLANEQSEMSSESSLVRNIYMNITGNNSDKTQKSKENKCPSPKKASFQISSKQQGKEIDNKRKAGKKSKQKENLLRNSSVKGAQIYNTADNRMSSPSLTWKSNKRDSSKEEERINRYIQSKKMKFNMNNK